MITARRYRRSTVPLQTYPKNNLEVKAVRRRMKVPREVSNDCNATAVKLFFWLCTHLMALLYNKLPITMSATNALITFDLLILFHSFSFLPDGVLG